MAYIPISTANAQPLVSQRAGVIQVPLFDAPYTLPEIPNGPSAAPLLGNSWWPLLGNADNVNPFADFMALLLTPFQRTKFAYNEAALADHWGSGFSLEMLWYGNRLVVGGPINVKAPNSLCKMATLPAILGIDATYLFPPLIYNMGNGGEPLSTAGAAQTYFFNDFGFPSACHLAALTGGETNYNAYSTSTFGNWNGFFTPPLFNEPFGRIIPQMHITDLGPSVGYVQPDFVNNGNYYFFSQTGNGNWKSIFVAYIGGNDSIIPNGFWKVTFDDATLNAGFTTANFSPNSGPNIGVGWAANFAKGHIWISTAADAEFNQNQTVVILSNDMTKYWRVKFLPQSQAATNAIATPTFWSLKIDPLGAWHFKPAGTAAHPELRSSVFNSQDFGFEFDFPTLNLPANDLPCFQTCYPVPSRQLT